MDILMTNARAYRAGLPIDVRNTLPVLKLIATGKPVYYIEAVTVSGQCLQVDYTLNDEWLITNIQLSALKSFMISNGLNDYCFDTSDHTGSHIQEAGTLEPEHYLAANLSSVVAAYIAAKGVGQYHVN